ncbi:MAG: hypothetical protein RBQ64_05775, partial [Candidatus Izemoplasmatales bacterium]|nr:hypothetical protein [Candidatus Izemoplasmatales bacterium]
MFLTQFDFGILLSLNLIFYIVLGLAVLFGFLSGLKKSLYKLITMAIFYILFFVTLNLVVGIIWSADLSFLGPLMGDNIDPSLASFTSFEASYQDVFAHFLGSEIDLTEMSEEFMIMTAGIIQFAIKIVWTVLYFTVILIIYKFICFIIRIIFFKTKKGANKMRGFGAIVGAANGLMAIFIMLIVMGGTISILDSMSSLMEQFATEEDNTQTLNFVPRENLYEANYTLLAEPTDPGDNPLNDPMVQDALDILNQMVDEYNSNIFVKAANAIQVKSVIDEDVTVPMHINLFDSVLSFEYKETQVAFRYELGVFAEAFAVFAQSEYMETENISDIKGDEIRDLFAIIANSKLIISAVPIAIEYASIEFEQELPFEVEELYDGTINFEEELATIGVIAGQLFDILNGAGFIEGEGDVSQIEVTGETVIDIFDNIAGSQVITTIIETVLFPMLEDSDDQISAILVVPSDLVLEDEIRALGEIFAEVVEADLDFEALTGGDVSTTIKTLAQVDLTILLESRLVTEALINILSGNAGIDGIDFFTIPADIVWKDSEDEVGELRQILEAVNALLEVSEDINLEDLDLAIIADMDSETIATFFESYVIRATVTDLIKEMPMQDMALIFPDVVFDENDYFTETELINVAEAIKLIIVVDEEETTFDPNKILTLTDLEVDTLFASDILYATVGNYFNTVDTSTFVVPQVVNTTIDVDGVPIDVVTKQELKNVFKALSTLALEGFEGVEFDASYINRLESDTQDDIDEDKVNTILESLIIYATLSDVVIDLDKSVGGQLVVPDKDVDNNDIVTFEGDAYYIAETEIINVLRAMYSINITDFNNIDLEDTNLLKDNFDVLIESAIIHATISDVILNIGSTVIVPDRDSSNVPILVTTSDTFIIESELNAMINSLNLLGVSDPNSFQDFNFANLDDDTKRYQLMDSAILHATITDQLLNLGDNLLKVPEQDELGNDLILETGSLPNKFVAKTEINAIIKAMIAMGYTDVNNLTTEIDPNAFLDNKEVVLESATMQATVSEQILAASASIVIPEVDSLSNPVKIVFTDVTFIESTELNNFFNSIELFGITNLDFNTFTSYDFAVLSTDQLRYDFLESSILHATVSKQLFDLGSNVLTVPEQDELGNDLVIETGSLPERFVVKSEINAIMKAMIGMGYSNVNSVTTEINPQTFLDNKELVLASASMQATVSAQILAASASLQIPEVDSLSNPVKIVFTDVTYIESTELNNFFNSIELFGITNLDFNTFTSYDFGVLSTDALRYEFLQSSILHATITKQLFDVGPSILLIPEQDELGNDLIIETVDLEFIKKAEINAIMKAMIAMGYTDVQNLTSTIDSQVFIDNVELVLESASMHATVSNQILGATTTSLIIPDEDLLANEIRIIYTDVTFIESTELNKFFDSIDLLAIPNLDFNNVSQFNLTNIQSLDKNIFFDSFIMLATVSDYFLDAAVGDETYGSGTTNLLIPSTKKITILVETVSAQAIDKTEMIYMLDAFDVLGLADYNSNFDATVITGLTSPEIDQVLLSDSVHITVDSMLRGNASISGGIPALAED